MPRKAEFKKARRPSPSKAGGSLCPSWRVCLAAVAVVHFAFSYRLLEGWWYSGLATILILSLAYLPQKKELLCVIGLPLGRHETLTSAGYTVAAFFASAALLQSLSGGDLSQWSRLPPDDLIHCIFYTLNEEIVLGAIPIFLLSRSYPNHPLAIAAVVAFGSAAAHYLFFGWVYPERGFLGVTTLLTLFLAALFRNNLIIIFRHVGYAWAVHLGWMSAMFSVGHHLSEPERFNAYLGATPVLVVVLVPAALSCLPLIKDLPFGERKGTASHPSRNQMILFQTQERHPSPQASRGAITVAGATRLPGSEG